MNVEGVQEQLPNSVNFEYPTKTTGRVGLRFGRRILFGPKKRLQSSQDISMDTQVEGRYKGKHRSTGDLDRRYP